MKSSVLTGQSWQFVVWYFWIMAIVMNDWLLLWTVTSSRFDVSFHALNPVHWPPQNKLASSDTCWTKNVITKKMFLAFQVMLFLMRQIYRSRIIDRHYPFLIEHVAFRFMVIVYGCCWTHQAVQQVQNLLSFRVGHWNQEDPPDHYLQGHQADLTGERQKNSERVKCWSETG